MSNPTNRRIVLASRPFGAPTQSNFQIETELVPVPTEGQMLLRTVYSSLDPYMRGRMSDEPSYAPPVKLGAVMIGATVGRVEVSHHPDFAVGDWVLCQSAITTNSTKISIFILSAFPMEHADAQVPPRGSVTPHGL